MESFKTKQKGKVKTSKLKHPKKLDIDKFFGVMKWEEDAVVYQRKLRDGQ